mgnify:CR=1 FL=1
MYDYVIFDVDGTLIDTNEATLMALHQVLREMTGQEYAYEDLRFAIGIPGESSLPKLGIRDIETANLKWNQSLQECAEHIQVYTGIRELLTALQEMNIDMGVVTSNTKYELNGLLPHFQPIDLMASIPYAICADDTERHKPYPDPMLRLLEISRYDPARAIYIGDTEYDKQCAEAANVDFGLAAWGNGMLANEMNVQHIFHTPEDILKVVNGKQVLEPRKGGVI